MRPPMPGRSDVRGGGAKKSESIGSSITLMGRLVRLAYHNGMSATLTANLLSERTERCRRAQETWNRLTVRERLRPVKTLRRLLVAECTKLCEAVALDLGKTSEETVGGDILPLAD